MPLLGRYTFQAFLRAMTEEDFDLLAIYKPLKDTHVVITGKLDEGVARETFVRWMNEWGASVDSVVRPSTDWLLAVAYSGFFLKLFNLIPVSPLDGGRITAVLSPRIWLLGVPLLVGLFLWRPSPMLLLIAVLAWPQLWKAWKYRSDSPEGQTYYAVPAAVKWEYGTYYVVLAAFLALMSHDVHEMLQQSARVHGLG